MGQTFSFTVDFLRVQLFTKLPVTHDDLTGRTYLVTGSNTGLGLALAIHLARLHPRPAHPRRSRFWELDMASFASVIQFAERANTTLNRLDGAVLNAGVNKKDWDVTPDGWERTLQTNVLSTGLLGVLLLPLLQTTSKLPSPRPESAIPPHLTITSSEGMTIAKFSEKSASSILKAMNDQSQCPDMLDRYFTSKLLNLFLAREIAKLPQTRGVVIKCVLLFFSEPDYVLIWAFSAVYSTVTPGLCVSELGRDYDVPAVAAFILGLLSFTAAQGALNLLYAVLRPTPPAAYIYGCKVVNPPTWTESKEGLRVQAKLWSEMVELWRTVCPEVVNIRGL
ncbi:hypothetical protein MSAN_01208900 [Mycena sanguinolenta]|uniref:NAD(P)-binding protein n=1 Tax=Mycena sanguinolenta TaxID=230812 RepID=A0A8H6YI69_9AGAR|nr:hypothetical protein MSAN_01208900 [Mycena sanguinolenta]